MNTSGLLVSAPLLTAVLSVIGLEIKGVVQDPGRHNTITGDWRLADAWLKTHSPAADWFFRVLTVGLLTWATLHTAGVW